VWGGVLGHRCFAFLRCCYLTRGSVLASGFVLFRFALGSSGLVCGVWRFDWWRGEEGKISSILINRKCGLFSWVGVGFSQS
jgi:hypothetical protein